MSSDNRLMLALIASLLLHGVVLMLHFQFPETSRRLQNKALDIILVNARSERAPNDAQALAQTNLDGGGNTDEDRRVKTNLPPKKTTDQGSELERRQQRVRELEAKQQKLLARNDSVHAIKPTNSQARDKTRPMQSFDGMDLAESARAMARMQGEISQSISEYNKRPRRKFIGARTREMRFARYIEDWRQKVERVGTLNYPSEAKGKLYGTLLLTVSIRADGSVANVHIDRSSGHKILDNAARRIIQLAAPYAKFPPEISQDTDIVDITRVWYFTTSDQFATK